MTTSIDAIGWPLARLGTLLVALAERNAVETERHAVAGAEPPTLAPGLDAARERDLLGRWLEHHASSLGLELEPTHVELGELARSLPRLGPALVLVRGESGELRVLALEPGRRRGHLRVLGPDLADHAIALEQLAACMSEPLLAPLRAGADAILSAAEIPSSRRERAREALLQRRAATAPIAGIWQVRLPPAARLATQLGRERVPSALAVTALEIGRAHV